MSSLNILIRVFRYVESFDKSSLGGMVDTTDLKSVLFKSY